MKKLYTYLFVLSFLLITTGSLYAQPQPSIYKNWENGFTDSLKNTRDMALPSWGPYSDKYNGISHIPAANRGLRFDVSVQPSFYLRNLIPLANVKRESGYHPWKASPDLSYFSYRFELEWKDKVFCDVSFSKVDEEGRLIKSEFVNNTDRQQSLALNIFNSIAFPFKNIVKPILPEKAIWQRAADYISFTDSVKAWNYNLVYDGHLRGQVKDDNAVSHTAIVVGNNKGEKLTYHLAKPEDINNRVLMLRYVTVSGEANIEIEIDGKLVKTIALPDTKEYAHISTELNNLPEGNSTLSFKVKDGSVIKLDGFVLVKKEEVASIGFKKQEPNDIPKQINTGLPNAFVLKFDDIDEFYGLVWNDLSADNRELFDNNPDRVLSLFNHLVKAEKDRPEVTKINGNKEGWFKNVFSAPIIVDARSRKTLYAYIVSGTDQNKVLDKLELFNKQWLQAEAISNNQESKAHSSKINKAGEPYTFSQQLMEATTLTNLIYPTFTTNRYIKHTTPGKRWSSLYTWDSGFIGLGYSALNLDRALESLNAYTMDREEQSAFLEHGTPLPVQAYLFNELWNKTQNTAYLTYFYPRLKRYYDFLGGAESSPTRRLQSNLIKTWDIFYNSGGWDDYSPQVFVHKHKLRDRVAPTVNTAHQIRFAKLLKMAAWQLGYQQDIKKYDEDITMYSTALQDNAWDHASGYYGYVKHDAEGKATGILRHPSGQNFNMGIDGCSPLIAGICNPNQKGKIIKHLFTKGELWTDYGITAIDQKAPYYNKDGYWNGRVWMPHQWFFWKTMLDVNEPEKAIQIAQTALKVWKRETEDSYNCWENFSAETGHGGGWHQFGALSSPVLNWYSSLFKPGTITYGFNVWPISHKFSGSNERFEGKLKLFADGKERVATILLCLNDVNDYEARCNGKSIPLRKVLEGLYAVKIELGEVDNDIFNLLITKKRSN